jgi:hypothetical protein
MSRGSVQRFSTVIEGDGDRGAFVSIPFDVERVYGKARVPVKATIDGEPYLGSLVRMGGPSHLLLVPGPVCETIGKGPGDPVDVVVDEDLRPRAVAVPGDLRRALEGEPRALAFFRGLASAGREEYVRWIEAAKQERARAGRVARATRMLRQGKGKP